MMSYYDDNGTLTTAMPKHDLSAPKYDKHPVPMPSRDELLRRNSFGSPDDNKYLNAVKPTAAVPKTPDEESRRLAVQKKWGMQP